MNMALDILLSRRSCRAYEAGQIAEDALNDILKAVQYAPTGMGKQSPLMVAVQDPETLARLERLNSTVLGNPEGHPFYGAPTAVVVFAASDAMLHIADANLVIGNLLNGAHAVGVDSCYIWRAREVFESEEGKALKAAWGIPEEYIGAGNVILGYGAPEGKREAVPRKEDYVRRV